MMGLKGKVVVITGASSGIGREAAVQFAREGCRVVLAARRQVALEHTARLCRAAGGEALWLVTDVTYEQQVKRLVDGALSQFGRIDIWVNNAGVTLFARLEDGPFHEHRRVIETNLYGAMFGARAVVPIFRLQREGTLINIGSILSKIGQPFVPSYVISKFAVRGLSEALRAELADQPNIHICTLLPYAIDTPHFQSGANEIGREAHAMPPVLPPQKVARAIVQLAKRPRRERHVPHVAALGLALHWFLPRTTERMILHALEKWHFGATEPPKPGNLYYPSHEKGASQGVRPPRISAPRLGAWVVGDLVRTEIKAAARRVGYWGADART